MSTDQVHSRDDTPFRVRTLRTALWVVWLLLAAASVLALRAGRPTSPSVWIPLSAAGVAAVVGSALRWQNLLGRRPGEVLLGLWAALNAVVVASLAASEGVWAGALLLAFALVVFSASLAPTMAHHGLVMVVATCAVLVGPALGRVGYEEAAPAGLALLVVGGVAASAVHEVRRQAAIAARVKLDLAGRDAAFERLHEVTTTLTAGSSLQRVLPELVGRIGRYLRAQVGLVVLHDPGRGVLEVVSPIWTAGYALEIEGYTLSPNGPGEIERVFRTGAAGLYHDLAQDPDSHSVLGELGARNAACVPLRVDQRTIGVLVLADREEGDFGPSDLESLASLAGPAALVVSQMGRIEQAAETTRRMEDLARMKSDFVSVVSHELRTPLTSIIGSLATLSRPELRPEGGQAAELLSSAQAQADRLRRLIEDLLMASRIEHGGLPHTPSSIEMGPFLTDAVATVATGDRSIAIDVREGAERITADPDHLSRVVINLLDNALKYAPSSPIDIVVQPQSGRFTISVIDHGSGIELAERDRAFERFTQLEPAQTRSQGGAGLGLSIVRGLVQAMGGTLDLVETPGGGATFVVTLPMVAARERERGSLEVLTASG